MERRIRTNLTNNKGNGRAWCFTLVNYTEEEADVARDWMEEEAAYAVFGWELADETYTPHIQGYFRMNRSRTIRYLDYGGLIPIQ